MSLTNIIIRDQLGTAYHLISFGSKRIGVMLSPHRFAYSWSSVFHWTSSRWYYDTEHRRIMMYIDIGYCLTANPNTFTLSLANCSLADHQTFEYDIKKEELFWIHSSTQRKHPIYLENNIARIVETQAFISRHPVTKSISDRIRTFAEDKFPNASHPDFRMRALTLYSLQKAIPNMSSCEYRKYLEILESLHEEFDYFTNEKGEHLIGDGHTVTLMKKQQFMCVKYGYHGLWNKNQKNQLMHFLSGKYLQAVPRDKHRNFKLFQHMLNSIYLRQAFEDINSTFYHLTLSAYSKVVNDSFVFVKRSSKSGRNQMCINDGGQSKRIKHTLMIQGPNKNSLLLAFIDIFTFHQVQWILAGSIHWTAMIDNANPFWLA